MTEWRAAGLRLYQSVAEVTVMTTPDARTGATDYCLPDARPFPETRIRHKRSAHDNGIVHSFSMFLTDYE